MRGKNIKYASAALSVPIVPAAWLAQQTEKQEIFSRNLSVFFTMSSERFQEVSVFCSCTSPLQFLLSIFFLCPFPLCPMLCCASMLPRRSFCVCLGPPSLSHATWMSNLRALSRLIISCSLVYSDENLFINNKISQKTQDSLRPSEIRLGKRWLKLLHPFEFRVHKTSAVRSLSRPSEDVARNSKICKR